MTPMPTNREAQGEVERIVVPLFIKRCMSCDVVKGIDQFYPHEGMADGHLNKCIDCTRLDAIDYRNKNLEVVREKDAVRSRNPSPERVAKRKIQGASYAAKHPTRRRAYSILRRAVKAGHIEKLPCAFCRKRKVRAHFYDYEKPLEVTWICHGCSGQFHALAERSRQALQTQEPDHG